MKKLVLFFAAVVAVAFASCGAKATEEATEEVAVEEVAVEEVVDTAAVVVIDSAVVAE
ncbi:MAG TPA: hypothetical protein PLJ40_00455 [Paludibacteraceae bacterium]|nr:hypothetical protein [Paludibacteraceae bacterium]HRS67071.1 hypothetical protein [Paludibacteraceae bacterium]